MVEQDRISILCQKLSNQRIEVRIRAASSLLFKLKSGLFQTELLTINKNSNQLVAQGVYQSLQLLLTNRQQLLVVNSLEFQLLQLLLVIVGHVCSDNSAPTPTEDYAKILECLYFLSSIELLDDSLLQEIDKVRSTSLSYLL